ncbi:hypothetical protein HMPREF0645_2232 [Hallella bergensis DSM 17361]|uniref:Uncharacterized protein n=1 Tax=Hallella bergensis DSM 17361 TaxID=585502 RepID=D1PZ47_9BACT|nr:hypothetical protein HMPREF0645_2232 [Hallella bergensis DSM 17361]
MSGNQKITKNAEILPISKLLFSFFKYEQHLKAFVKLFRKIRHGG